ncbi:replication terminator protein [Vagococcus fluvialis]|uniref:replication terminator protein n=1 Tax=Vagococcus fluvialis TaxID=2738 RepID=UPI0020331F43|nr:replication terminator protein [Vagococcus fluvialis]MCM2138924.1 replication terminator protein [Vagococcus fluvialis]
MKNIDLDLSDIAGGGLQEKVDLEMNKAFENIHDPNTKATAKRKLTITIELTPDENREVVSVTSNVKSTLAPLTDVGTTVLTGKNLDTGKVEARELKSSVPGQTYIDPEDLTQKTDIGEPIDVVEKEMEKQQQIIDLQQKRG